MIKMFGFDINRFRAIWWTMAVTLFITVIFIVHSFIGTFVFGIFIYYATRPVYRRIQNRVRQRSVAAGLALLVFALPVIALLTYTLAIGMQEMTELQEIDLGPYTSLIDPYLDISRLVQNPSDLLSPNGGFDTIQETLVSALGYVGFIGNGLLHLFVMFALAFYLLRDGHRLSEWVLKLDDNKGVMRAYARAVDTSFSNIFFGNILNAIMTAAIGAVSFSLVNLFAPAEWMKIPYPALTGLLAGAASLIPIVGMKLVYVPVVGYLGAKSVFLGAGFSFVVIVFLVSFLIVDSLPDLVLRPYVSGRNLHVGLVMFAYILGPLLFGWYGIFLGPMILVFVIHFARIVLPELVTGTAVRPVAVDPSYLTSEKSSPPPDEPNVGVSDGGKPEETSSENDN